MRIQSPFRTALLVAATLCFSGLTGLSRADELTEPLPDEAPSMFLRASTALDSTLGKALSLIGVPYKRGGKSPDYGFDCSGFVSHVFEQGTGLVLPHNAKAMSSEGEKVDKQALQPGDLVFFNTMRRAFSHVGIYVGEGMFVHSPRKGGEVRVENMNQNYWTKRYNGARRVSQ